MTLVDRRNNSSHQYLNLYDTYCMFVSVFRMRSLRKTVLLAILVSVVLVLALLHSWPTRTYTTVDVWQRPGPLVEKHVEERLTVPDHWLRNISFHVRDNVARYGCFLTSLSIPP